MFLGANTLNLDAKGRLAVPVKYRETLAAECASKVVVTLSPFGQGRCLWLYPDNHWQEAARQLVALPSTHKAALGIKRLMLGHAFEQELDGQGRILLPTDLRDFAGLEKRVVLVGQINKFEIWSEDAWGGNREEWLEDVSSEPGVLSDALNELAL